MYHAKGVCFRIGYCRKKNQSAGMGICQMSVNKRKKNQRTSHHLVHILSSSFYCLLAFVASLVFWSEADIPICWMPKLATNPTSTDKVLFAWCRVSANKSTNSANAAASSAVPDSKPKCKILRIHLTMSLPPIVSVHQKKRHTCIVRFKINIVASKTVLNNSVKKMNKHNNSVDNYKETKKHGILVNCIHNEGVRIHNKFVNFWNDYSDNPANKGHVDNCSKFT